MGVSLAAWRARIGTFSVPSCGVLYDNDKNGGSGSGCRLVLLILFCECFMSSMRIGGMVSQFYIETMIDFHGLSQCNEKINRNVTYEMRNENWVPCDSTTGVFTYDAIVVNFYGIHHPFVPLTLPLRNDTLTTPFIFPQLLLTLSNDVETNPGPGPIPATDYATKQDAKEINQQLGNILDQMKILNGQWNVLNERISDVEVRVQAVEQKCDEDNTQDVRMLENRVDKLKDELQHSKANCVGMQRTIDELEDRNRRSNILFTGIPEDKDETWEISEQKVRRIISDKMDIDEKTIDIERAHRIRNGPTREGSKHIIAMFSKYKDKDKIMKNAYKLKGTNIFVQDDYCKNTRSIQKILRDHRKEIKATGSVRKADVRYKKLVVEDHDGNRSIFTYDEETKELVCK